jgi:Tfp pilus assembly PilM family ATPase
LEVIVKEMEKTIQYFQTKGKGINQIVLTGGTSGLPDVASWLAKKLNIEIQIGNPFSQVTVGGILSKINTADVPLYACAVGLALKEIS